MNSMREGVEPDQGHLWMQDWASDLGQSRPETANSTGTGTGEQPLSQYYRDRDLCSLDVNLGPSRE